MITLETLGQATAQEVYNQAKEHLLTQNKKSMQDNNCQYRTIDYYGNTLKCAAGCFISDEEYKIVEANNLNTKPWRYVREIFKATEHEGLINYLQIVHDCNKTTDWADKLKKVAELFNLEP